MSEEGMTEEHLFVLLGYYFCQGVTTKSDTFDLLASKGYTVPAYVGCGYEISDKGKEFIKKVMRNV